VGLALSGGKDSRLVLAGLLANGIEVQTSTVSMGSANDGDVSIARRIAELTGIRHSVRPALTEGGLPADRVVDVYSDTCHTLRLTECMLHGFKTFAPRTHFRSDSVSLGGGGGEVLRGGYGHGFLSPKLQPLAQVVSREIVKRFTRFAPVIRRDVLDAYRSQLHDELAETSSGLSGAQLLDRAYLDYRSSCWLAMSLRAPSLTGIVVHPACDNAVVAAAVAIDAAERSSERVTYELMRRLSPKLAALPFADDE
jgi:asparagine synthetase B (glutamine-hydrolysing)